MITYLHTYIIVPWIELQMVVGLRSELGSTRCLVVANTKSLEIVHAQHDTT